MARAIHFNFDEDEMHEEEMHFDFGTYVLMLYYAKQLDNDKAQLLFDCTEIEYLYRLKHNIATDDLADDYEAHFNVSDIQQVVGFIEDQLIPALNNETQDLIEKYGGVEGFKALFYADKVFREFNIFDDEWYYSDPEQMASVIDAFKCFLQYALSINKAYTVYMH